MPAIDEQPLFVTRKVFLRRLARRLAASAVAMAALHLLSQSQRGETPFVPSPAASMALSEAMPRVPDPTPSTVDDDREQADLFPAFRRP